MNQLSLIRNTLSRFAPVLKERYHVSSLGLFGSVVRSDFSPQSDIDIIVDFSQPIGVEFIDLANELELLLNRKVDLVSKKGIKKNYLAQIENEIIYV